MTFSQLYDHCQTLLPKIKRNDLKDKVIELSCRGKIRTMKTTLDVASCRGFYLSAGNCDHQFVKQHGSTVIVLARGLNPCWERFVFTKELMHHFDDPAEASDSGDKFERMLEDLVPGGRERSPQADSEVACFWMALAVLCPESYRKKFDAERRAGRLDDYAIALQLRIPQVYVHRLFEDQYLKNIEKYREMNK
ncbi:MAG: hypothetical protein HQL37_12925 [Alphaproteobacteria bacterium]|nr:hypothetical protein [Alphaproteobacteria bacterium]